MKRNLQLLLFEPEIFQTLVVEAANLPINTAQQRQEKNRMLAFYGCTEEEIETIAKTDDELGRWRGAVILVRLMERHKRRYKRHFIIVKPAKKFNRRELIDELMNQRPPKNEEPAIVCQPIFRDVVVGN